MCALHPKNPFLSVGFQIDTRNKFPILHERQNVITILPLFRRNIDFDAVIETENTFHPVAFPHDRIERYHQGGRFGTAPRVDMRAQISRLFPTLDIRLQQHAVLDHFGNARLGIVGRQAEILPKVGLRRDPHRGYPVADQGTLGLGTRHGWFKRLRADDPFGQVINPLETGAPFARHHLPAPEQEFHRGFGL